MAPGADSSRRRSILVGIKERRFKESVDVLSRTQYHKIDADATQSQSSTPISATKGIYLFAT